jgi:hypothetical protein
MNFEKIAVNIESLSNFNNPLSVNNVGGKNYISAELTETNKELISNTIRYRGTGFLVKSATRTYLVTAKHLISDMANPEITNTETRRRYCNIIMRIPCLFEFSDSGKMPPPTFISNINAGAIPLLAVSDDELDLVAIDLRFQNIFLEEVKTLGIHAFSFEEILDDPGKISTQLCAVGFPPEISYAGDSLVPEDLSYLYKNQISMPTVTHGHVAMNHHDLHYFWADLTVYGGNSGGPAIVDNKIAGIVTGQAFQNIEDFYDDQAEIDVPLQAKYRIPMARCIKGRLLKELINSYEELLKSYGL